MTSLQFETRFASLVDAINEESKLPERQWVWVLESSLPGRLCVRFEPGRLATYIEVFPDEDAAVHQLLHGLWHDPHDGVSPIMMAYESVLLQASEQGPTEDGIPCRGVWIAERDEFIEIEGKPEGTANDRGFI